MNQLNFNIFVYVSVFILFIFEFVYDILFHLGTPLNWEQSKQYHSYIKEHGILQFLHIYQRMKDRANDSFLWGDEVNKNKINK
jgi:hypothetical protein